MSSQKTRHQNLNSYWVMNSLVDKNMSTQQRYPPHHIGTYNLVPYIIDYSSYTKFQIFIVVTGWVFTDNTQELIMILCLRLKYFIRKIPSAHRSLKFSVHSSCTSLIRMDEFYNTFYIQS